MVDGAFSEFAQTADAVAATSKKLAKAALLQSYFAGLGDADLARAARFFAGQVFAASDTRTTQVGGSLLREALSDATGIGFDQLDPWYVRFGDAGEVACAAVGRAQTPGVVATLTLADVEQILENLSATRGAKNKKTVLRDALARSTAPEAKYLVKLLAGDLRIGLQEGLVEDAIARAFHEPLERVARANMLSGDIGETAVRARAGSLGEVSMRLFHPIKFMLATAAADASDAARTMPERFLVEDKFDGIRAQAHVGPGGEGARVALYTRTLDEVSHRFPELVGPLGALLERLPAGCVLDGEIVAERAGAILPFAELQKRLGRKTVGEELLASAPVVLVVFDVLYADGRVRIDDALSERREALESVLEPQGVIRCAESRLVTEPAALDAEIAAARARGNEGLMVKDPRSPYRPGRRGREWLKIKRALATLDVVVTAVEVGHGKRRDLLSDYTFAVRRSEESGELLNVGKAYSGLTDAELEEMTEWFRAHTLQAYAHGRVRIVEPKVVLEVAFDRVQESKRHKSGYALRFPRILRLRADKSPAEIDTLESVRALARLR